MRIFTSEQGSNEWLLERAGHFTASSANDLFMKETTKTYQDLINKVVFEKLTGEIPEQFKSNYMVRGNLLEAEARERYKMETFNDVEEIGFWELDEFIGMSSDGMIGQSGSLEIKVPKYSTLIDYLLTDKVPLDYTRQMQFQMMVSGRAWTDFYVWHPKLKSLLKRVNRDEVMIKEIKDRLDVVIQIAKQRIERLNKH